MVRQSLVKKPRSVRVGTAVAYPQDPTGLPTGYLQACSQAIHTDAQAYVGRPAGGLSVGLSVGDVSVIFGRLQTHTSGCHNLHAGSAHHEFSAHSCRLRKRCDMLLASEGSFALDLLPAVKLISLRAVHMGLKLLLRLQATCLLKQAELFRISSCIIRKRYAVTEKSFLTQSQLVRKHQIPNPEPLTPNPKPPKPNQPLNP